MNNNEKNISKIQQEHRIWIPFIILSIILSFVFFTMMFIYLESLFLILTLISGGLFIFSLYEYIIPEEIKYLHVGDEDIRDEGSRYVLYIWIYNSSGYQWEYCKSYLKNNIKSEKDLDEIFEEVNKYKEKVKHEFKNYQIIRNIGE